MFTGKANFLKRHGSRILGSIGITLSIGWCHEMICDIFYCFCHKKHLSYNFSEILIQWHILSFHSLSDELAVTFLFLIVGVSYFHVFGEAFSNHILY